MDPAHNFSEKKAEELRQLLLSSTAFMEEVAEAIREASTGDGVWDEGLNAFTTRSDYEE